MAEVYVRSLAKRIAYVSLLVGGTSLLCAIVTALATNGGRWQGYLAGFALAAVLGLVVAGLLLLSSRR